MNGMLVFSIIMLVAVFIAACSQVILKREANQQHKSILSEYLNCRVVGAYALFGFSAVINLYVLRHIPLSLAPVLESTGYIFIAVFGYVFLGEKINKRQFGGFCLIILGIIVYSI